ncbi:MAG: dienelactone hydrolase family protein [Bdellovibrionales bacterium]|nr:dienelactone hydrolase family protein [Bdellovibrionales bacterium]
MRFGLILPVLLFFLAACQTHDPRGVASDGETIRYKVAGTEHIGFIASGAKPGEKKPGVIIVHEWWGLNDYARSRAKQLADLGYVAMAVDMYGGGKIATHPGDAGAFSKKAMSDFPLAKKRFEEAMTILKARPDVDPDKIVAIGYCFGGAVVLNMARAGVDLDLIASFHGSLASPMKAKPGVIKGKVLVFNGKADPFVKKEDIAAFKKEMKVAHVNFEFFNYEGAKHAFTNKGADEYGKKFKIPLAYNQKADADSWSQFIKALKTL